MLDHPDWLDVSAGSQRLVGSLPGSGTLAFALQDQERSIIVVVPSNSLAATTVVVQTGGGIATKLSTFPVSAIATPGVAIAFANPSISATWQVVVTADPTQTIYVFADSDLATVAIASDETAPVYAQVVNNGPLSGGGAISPLYTQLVHGNTDLIGQQIMAGSLPVAIASDQSSVPVAAHPTVKQSVDFLNIASGAGVGPTNIVLTEGIVTRCLISAALRVGVGQANIAVYINTGGVNYIIADILLFGGQAVTVVAIPFPENLATIVGSATLPIAVFNNAIVGVLVADVTVTIEGR